MRTLLRFCLLYVAVAVWTPLQAQTVFTEPFDSLHPEGEWSWGTGTELLLEDGGNPGTYLHEYNYTDLPQARTLQGADTLFHGDYRAAQVSMLGIDLQVFYSETAAEGVLSLMLVHDNNTELDYSDDWAAYTTGMPFPQTGEGWLSYQFNVPSAATTRPAGWTILELGDRAPANPSWNTLITSVSQVRFCLGDPSKAQDSGLWEVGMDNATLTYGAETSCEEDLNDDGVVDRSDMSILLQNMGKSGPGDLNGDGEVTLVDAVILRNSYGSCV